MGKVLIRKSLTADELPQGWLEGRTLAPTTPLTVTIELAAPPTQHRLVDFIGAGHGLFASAAEVDAFIRRERDGWPL